MSFKNMDGDFSRLEVGYSREGISRQKAIARGRLRAFGQIDFLAFFIYGILTCMLPNDIRVQIELKLMLNPKVCKWLQKN